MTPRPYSRREFVTITSTAGALGLLACASSDSEAPADGRGSGPSSSVLAHAGEGESGPPPPIDGGFTLVVVPDSQNYVWKRPELYTLQTGWIAANVERYRMMYLLHVGDITQVSVVGLGIEQPMP